VAAEPDDQAEAELLRQMMTGGETPRPPTAPDSGVIHATYRILAGEEIANGVENLLSLTHAVTRTERRKGSVGDHWYVDVTLYGNVTPLSIFHFAAGAEEILGVESGTILLDKITP